MYFNHRLRSLSIVCIAFLMLLTSCGNKNKEIFAEIDSTKVDSSFGEVLGLVSTLMASDSVMGGIYLPEDVYMNKAEDSAVLNLTCSNGTYAYLGKTTEGKAIELKGQRMSLAYSLVSATQIPEPGIAEANDFYAFVLNAPCSDCKTLLQTTDRKTTIASGGFYRLSKNYKVEFLKNASIQPSFFEEMPNQEALKLAMETFAKEYKIVQDFQNSYLSEKGSFVAVSLAGRAAIVFMPKANIPSNAVVIANISTEEINSLRNLNGFLFPSLSLKELEFEGSKLQLLNAGL